MSKNKEDELKAKEAKEASAEQNMDVNPGTQEDQANDELSLLKANLAEINDKYLRLYSEFKLPLGNTFCHQLEIMNKRLTLLIPVLIVFGLVLAFSFSNRPEARDIRVKGPKIGDMAPEISLATAEGKMIPLSSLKGKIVLIDFWASWCKPCRQENPNLVRTYEKFHTARFKNAKEFTIYSVSLDDDVEKWQNAIKKDKLNWENHVSDLMRWESPAASVYGVEAIPSNFLLDETGKIIAINVSAKELDNALKELQ